MPFCAVLWEFPPVLLAKSLLFCISRSTSMHSCFVFLFLPLSASSHPLSAMKRFAFCTIRPSIQGQHPRGHINSTVRTMPPSRQLPSASIPSRERERREKEGQCKSQRLGLFRKEEKGRREKKQKQKNKWTWPHVFFPQGMERDGVTVDLGLSLLSCLGHNSECVDVCGCLCAKPPRHHYRGTRWGTCRPGALHISHLVSEERTAKDSVCRAAAKGTCNS